MKKMLFVLFIFTSYLLNAQWSNDPTLNTAVCDLAGSQAIPKIATSTEGDIYIGWFSNETGNYDVRLQRFDSNGNELWAHNGILISDNPSMSWLTDWDMTVDEANHAILTFQDIRNGGNNNVYAYRISPAGDFIWGDDGLELSNSVAFDVSPKVTVTGIGNAVIAWQSEDVIIMQKISPEGTLLWGDNGIILSSNNTYSWPQLLPTDSEEIILKFFDDSGPPYSPTRYVYAQKFDTDGNPLWADNTVISNAGGISAWTQIFPIVSDRNGGFFIAWHDDRDSNMLADIFIQHVDANGQTLFTDDGLAVSLMPNRNHFYPELAFPENSTDTFVFWNEMDSNQNQRGIYGQKISDTGDRLWTDNGMAFIHLTPTDVYPTAARSSESDVVVFYKENLSPLNNQIKAMKIDPEGAFVWDDEQITLSSVASEKLHNVVSHYYNNQWIAAWEDRRTDNGDIYAQNITLDGTLGLQLLPPQNLVIEVVNYNDVHMEWDPPASEDIIIQYHTGYDNNGIGNGLVYWICAARFTPDELINYYGDYQISHVKVHIRSPYFSFAEIIIWEGGSIGYAGFEVYSQDITNSVIIEDWTIHELTTPIPIISNNEYWIGYGIDVTGDYPSSVDAGPAVPEKGDWMFFYSQGWFQISVAYGLDYNWCITGILSPIDSNDKSESVEIGQAEKLSDNEITRDLIGYKIYRDGIVIEILDPTQTTYDDLALDSGVYEYGITAVYDEGESVWLFANIIIMLIPPQNFSAVVQEMNNVFCSWDSLVSTSRDFNSYNVYRDNLLIAIGITENFYLDVGVPTGTYEYCGTAVYDGGWESEFSNPATVTVDVGDLPIPLVTELIGNYPNPFNPSTTIYFTTESTENTELVIYNIKGQKIKTLECGESLSTIADGVSYSITWNGTDENNQPVSSGIYFYRLEAGKYTATKKMILMK